MSFSVLISNGLMTTIVSRKRNSVWFACLGWYFKSVLYSIYSIWYKLISSKMVGSSYETTLFHFILFNSFSMIKHHHHHHHHHLETFSSAKFSHSHAALLVVLFSWWTFNIQFFKSMGPSQAKVRQAMQWHPMLRYAIGIPQWAKRDSSINGRESLWIRVTTAKWFTIHSYKWWINSNEK